MSSMLDIIFSSILGGVILLITINANAIVRESWYVYNGDVTVQNMLTQTAQIVESELRNLGSGFEEGRKSMVYASDTCIQFKLKMRSTSTKYDSIKFFSGSVNEMSFTENPRDRFLYRQFNRETPQRIGVVSLLRFRYFNDYADTIPTPVVDLPSIKTVEITLEVQNPYAIYRDPSTIKPGEMDALYSTSVWKQTRIASQNLKR